MRPLTADRSWMSLANLMQHALQIPRVRISSMTNPLGSRRDSPTPCVRLAKDPDRSTVFRPRVLGLRHKQNGGLRYRSCRYANRVCLVHRYFVSSKAHRREYFHRFCCRSSSSWARASIGLARAQMQAARESSNKRSQTSHQRAKPSVLLEPRFELAHFVSSRYGS